MSTGNYYVKGSKYLIIQELKKYIDINELIYIILEYLGDHYYITTIPYYTMRREFNFILRKIKHIYISYLNKHLHNSLSSIIATYALNKLTMYNISTHLSLAASLRYNSERRYVGWNCSVYIYNIDSNIIKSKRLEYLYDWLTITQAHDFFKKTESYKSIQEL